MANGPVLKLLFIGDVVGKGGRKAVHALLPELKKEYGCTFAIVNAENSAAGAGISASCLDEMQEADVFTSGDHVWDQKAFEEEIRRYKNVLRPANFSERQPGNGWGRFRNPAGGDVVQRQVLRSLLSTLTLSSLSPTISSRRPATRELLSQMRLR